MSGQEGLTREVRLALIGFGNVHKGLIELINEKGGEIKEEFKIKILISAVFTRRLGFLVDENGLNLEKLVKNEIIPNSNITNIKDFLIASKANFLFEASSLDPHTGQPAIDYIKEALSLGIHSITANKGPIVHAASELQQLANEKQVQFRYEATFMGGIPIYSLLRECLPVAKLLKFRGMPNSTSTVVLESIEEGLSLDEGIKRAQEMGIAETDASMDIDGWDSAVKIVGLANTMMNGNLKLNDCKVKGIRTVTENEIRLAKENKTPIRLVASLEKQNDGIVIAKVEPTQLQPSDPLYVVHASDMFAHFEFDVLPAIELIARNSGAKETAYDMLSDFLNIVRRLPANYSFRPAHSFDLENKIKNSSFSSFFAHNNNNNNNNNNNINSPFGGIPFTPSNSPLLLIRTTNDLSYKVLLVGSGASGKTSFINALKREKFMNHSMLVQNKKKIFLIPFIFYYKIFYLINPSLLNVKILINLFNIFHHEIKLVYFYYYFSF